MEWMCSNFDQMKRYPKGCTQNHNSLWFSLWDVTSRSLGFFLILWLLLQKSWPSSVSRESGGLLCLLPVFISCSADSCNSLFSFHGYCSSSGPCLPLSTICAEKALSLYANPFQILCIFAHTGCCCSVTKWNPTLFVTPWTVASQAPLFSTISWSLLRFMSIE